MTTETATFEAIFENGAIRVINGQTPQNSLRCPTHFQVDRQTFFE
jgi:hypothetical protein